MGVIETANADGPAYRSLTIYYLSGTGNTYRVATWLAEAAKGLDIATQWGPVESGHPEAELSRGPEHLLALLMPAHGFTAPWTMIQFAALLPSGHRTHAMVASTRAGTKAGRWFICGMEGTAVYLIALILWLRGYRVRGGRGIDMPSNWLSLHPGFGESAARAIIARSRPHAERFFARILAGRRWYGSLVCLGQGLLLAPVSLGYLLIGRFGLAKLFFASTRCDGCGVCAAQCPRNAIRMTGVRNPRPYWTFDCESCMRCMAFCPRQAVEASHAFAFLLIQLPGYLIPAVVAGLTAYATRWSWVGHFTSGWGLSLLQYPLILGTYWISYRLVQWLNFWPPVNWLITWTTLTHLYRRSHEPDTKLIQLSTKGTRAFMG